MNVSSFVVVIVSTITTCLITTIACLSTTFNIRKHVLEVMDRGDFDTLTFNIRKHVLEVVDRGHFDTLGLLQSCELKKKLLISKFLWCQY